MSFAMFGCQGHDPTVECENCGTVIYNDAINCVQWCQYAETCVGTEEYQRLMEIAEMQKQRREEAMRE